MTGMTLQSFVRMQRDAVVTSWEDCYPDMHKRWLAWSEDDAGADLIFFMSDIELSNDEVATVEYVEQLTGFLYEIDCLKLKAERYERAKSVLTSFLGDDL